MDLIFDHLEVPDDVPEYKTDRTTNNETQHNISVRHRPSPEQSEVESPMDIEVLFVIEIVDSERMPMVAQNV